MLREYIHQQHRLLLLYQKNYFFARVVELIIYVDHSYLFTTKQRKQETKHILIQPNHTNG